MLEGVTLTVAVAVPLITALIGAVTNWAAVRMIFGPREFVGVGPIGWQGVIPAHNERFANDIADNVGAVLSARELAERLDPRSLEEELSVRLDEELPLMVAAVSEELSPGMWEQMADPARDVVIAQVRQSVLSTATETFDDLRSVSDELLDLHALVVDLLSGENTTRLVEHLDGWGGSRMSGGHPIYPGLGMIGHRAVARWIVRGSGAVRIEWRGGRGGRGALKVDV